MKLKSDYKILTLLLAVVFLLLAAGTIDAQSYRHELDELAMEFYRFGEVEGTLDEISRKEEKLEDKERDHDYYVQMAELEIFRAEIKEVAGIESPRDNYERALELAEKALEMEKTTRASRQAAESLSMLFDYRSLFFIIRNAGRAEEYLKDAEELAENDYMTELVMASYYIYAPERAGGDREKAHKLFEKIKATGHPVFQLAAMEAQAADYLDRGEKNKVEEIREKVRNLFPDNPRLEDFPLRN